MGSIPFFKTLNHFFTPSERLLQSEFSYFDHLFQGLFFFYCLFSLSTCILSTIFQVFMLADFSNLSAREHHHVQKKISMITKIAQIYFCDGGSGPGPLYSISFPWGLRDFTAKTFHQSSLQAFIFIYGTWKSAGASWPRQITKHHRRAKNLISAPAARA